MPPAGDKWDDWIALIFHDNEIDRVTLARCVGVRRTARIFREYCSQPIEIEILDCLARIDISGPNARSDKCGSWNRQCKIEGFNPAITADHNVRIFNTGIDFAVYKTGRARPRRQDARHLALEKKSVTRAVCGGRKNSMEPVGYLVRRIVFRVQCDRKKNILIGRVIFD